MKLHTYTVPISKMPQECFGELLILQNTLLAVCLMACEAVMSSNKLWSRMKVCFIPEHCPQNDQSSPPSTHSLPQAQCFQSDLPEAWHKPSRDTRIGVIIGCWPFTKPKIGQFMFHGYSEWVVSMETNYMPAYHCTLLPAWYTDTMQNMPLPTLRLLIGNIHFCFNDTTGFAVIKWTVVVNG